MSSPASRVAALIDQGSAGLSGIELKMGLVIDQFGLFGVALRPIDAGRVVAVICLWSADI